MHESLIVGYRFSSHNIAFTFAVSFIYLSIIDNVISVLLIDLQFGGIFVIAIGMYMF